MYFVFIAKKDLHNKVKRYQKGLNMWIYGTNFMNILRKQLNEAPIFSTPKSMS
jgi:hypothetical protein